MTTSPLATGRTDVVSLALPRPRTPDADNARYDETAGQGGALRVQEAALRHGLALLLGGGNTGEAPWQDRALCAETDPESFFPDKGGSTREAKKICTGCEVRTECLAYALANDERFGIWGGLSERERRRLRTAR